MKVSILIPAYNEEKTIIKCLEALKKIQGKSIYPMEIIVCNNNSSDNTEKVIRKNFPDVIVVNEQRQGIGFARQTAFEYSTGAVIACLDADTIPDPDWVIQGMKHFSDENVLSVAGLCRFSTDYKFAFLINIIQLTIFPILHFVSRLFGKGGMMLGGNVFIRRHALKSIGGFDQEMTFWGEDARTAQQIARLGGKMKYSPFVQAETSSRRFIENGLFKTGSDYVKAWINVVILEQK